MKAGKEQTNRVKHDHLQDYVISLQELQISRVTGSVTFVHQLDDQVADAAVTARALIDKPQPSDPFRYRLKVNHLEGHVNHTPASPTSRAITLDLTNTISPDLSRRRSSTAPARSTMI